MLALAFAGILCAAASLVATIPAFAADTHTITIKADNGAVVDPAGLPLGAPTRYYEAQAGSDLTFMFYPHNPDGPQFRIDKVLVDGVNVTKSLDCGTYTLSNIQADHTIEASSVSSTIDVEGFGFTGDIALGDTMTITPSPAGGNWWISDRSVLGFQSNGEGSYTLTGLKPGNAYAMYSVDDGKGPLIRRISIKVTHIAFDVGNLKYEVVTEGAPGGAGAPGENTVRVIGGADGASLESIVIPARVSGYVGSPGTVFEVAGIKSSAFSDNTTLESVDFSSCDVGNSFSVGNDVFRGCTSLKQLVFGQKTAPTIVNAFYLAPDDGTVYYPEGAQGYRTGMFKAVDGGNQLPNWTFESYPAPTAPQSLSAVPGDGKIGLSWTAPAGVMGIQKYQYSVTAEGGADSWQDVPGSDRSTASYEVTGLENGTGYTFKVRAINSVGAGEAASVTAAPPVKLVAVVTPRAVAGIANGTPLADIPLPSQVTLKTEKGDRLADVAWDRTATKPAYDPASPSKQTFAVSGTVTLPAGVSNPGDVPLETSVSVTVDAKVAPAKPQPSDPSQPKPLLRTGDGVLPLIPLGIAVIAGGAVLAARRLRLR